MSMKKVVTAILFLTMLNHQMKKKTKLKDFVKLATSIVAMYLLSLKVDNICFFYYTRRALEDLGKDAVRTHSYGTWCREPLNLNF